MTIWCAQVLADLDSLKCEHESLKTQHVMEVEDREKKIKELTSSLEQAEHTRLKQEKFMNELKSKLADMVNTFGRKHCLHDEHLGDGSVSMMSIWVMVV